MNKYGARKTVIDGITFDSKREAARYSELKLLERAGAITDLELQPVYPLEVNGRKISRFTADFRYRDAGGVVVEDVKSRATRQDRAWNLRKKLAEAIHGITVVEVL